MIETAQHTIGTTAVLVSAAHHMEVLIHFHNEEHGNSHPIYLGKSDVTTTTGLHLAVDQDIELTIPAGEELYAISDGAGRELHTIRIAED